MDIDEAYKYVQDLFRRGLVTIVGSGASCALGLPSMGQLGAELQSSIPARLSGMSDEVTAAWGQISARLTDGKGLEAALDIDPLPSELAAVITDDVADVVGRAERDAIRAMMIDPNLPAFGSLFTHILQNNDVADVITTNYDRLLEVAAAIAGIRVDTMFYGHTLGRLDERLSREELLEPVVYSGAATKVRLRARSHIRLAKPHGSLDWFAYNDTYVRSEYELTGARQIVAPGGSKYRLGYDIPFDQQRARANVAIDQASAFLVVGYGFNDDHLETHLKAAFPKVPAVVIAQTLSPNARAFLLTNSSAIGIEAKGTGARLICGADELRIPVELWQLPVLLKETLGI